MTMNDQEKLPENPLERAREEQQPEEENPQLDHLKPDEREEVEAVGAVVETPEEKQPPPGKMKIDLHCHTEVSADCSTPLELIPRRCHQQQIRVQAITDHNEIRGAQELQRMVADGLSPQGGPLTVIVGEEISTSEGEIIGLFLQERIEPGLTPAETVAQIKAQGGLVLIPHGFDPLKRWRLRPAALEQIVDQVDIVETFNARISRPKWNQAAVDWAQAHDVRMSAGSDAHILADIGTAWVEVPYRSISDPQGLLEALEGGKPVGLWTHPVLAYGYKFIDRTRRRVSQLFYGR